MAPKDEQRKTRTPSFTTSKGNPILKRKKRQLYKESEAHHPSHSRKTMKKAPDTFSDPDSSFSPVEEGLMIKEEPDTFDDPGSSSRVFKEGLEIKKEAGTHPKSTSK